MLPAGHGAYFARPTGMSVTESGKYVLFHNNLPKIPLSGDSTEGGYFIKNTETNETTRLGVPSELPKNTVIGNPTISPNGRYIGFSYQKSYRTYKGVVWDRLEDKLLTARYSDEVNSDCINSPSYFNIYPINEKYAYYSYMCSTNNKWGSNTEEVIGFTDIENEQSKVINIGLDGKLSKLFLSPNRFISNDGRYLTYVSPQQMDNNNFYSGSESETAIYLYDRVTSKHAKVISSQSNTDYIHNSLYSSISPDGKFLIYIAKKPMSETSSSNYGYLVTYSIDTKKFNYIAGPDNKILYDIRNPTISRDGESIAFTSKNSEYNLIGGNGYQAYFYDRVNQKMHHVSVSILTGESALQSGDAVVYGNGKGLIWSTSSPLVDKREVGANSGKFLYALSKSTIPDICKPYLE
ncbi:TolB-like translocation protein [Vibrio harveyi]|uniref:hypothetical protein n=1 Tax=Vibrio harveyi TaxID=669 RepID=UPI003909E8C0